MRLKQKLATMLAVLLVLLQGFPVFTVTAEGLQEPESTTIEISTPSETPNNPNNQPNASTEQPASPSVPTETPGSPPDADTEQETGGDLTAQEPETGGDIDEPAIPENSGSPEDAEGLQPPSDTQPPEDPIIEPEEQSEIPVFNVELVESGEHPGLYGTLSHIPKNAMNIAVEYSFGGASYYFVDDGLWELNEDSPDASPLTQLCMKLDERPYTVWQSGIVNSLYIRLSISCYDSDDIRTEPIMLSHQMTYPIPETAPPFTAEIVYLEGGYQVNGHFEDFPPDVVCLRPMYSLDGQEYKAVDELYPGDWWLEQLGTEDEKEKHYLENQSCMVYYEEPLAGYVAGKLDRFYLLLEITTESGVYHTEAAVIERGSTKPIPEGVSVKAAFPFTMRPLDAWGAPLDVRYGQYQVTAREGAPAEQIHSLLPDTLPLEVQLWTDNSTEMLTSGIVKVPATWKTLPSIQLMAGQQVILSDAVDALVIPSGTEVATPLGNFLLSELVTFDGDDKGQVHLVIDVVGRDEAPDVSLQENCYENSLDDIGALSLAFRLKPSGATAIKAYSFVEGDEDWTELCDLLARRDLNHNQAMGIYGFVTLLQPNDAPFHDYLKNGSSFLVGLKIEGGTFDGETVVLPWPGDYTPPAGIPEPGGSEGNENNAGSGGNDSTEEGQRPGLPQEPEQKPEKEPEAPPILPTPVEDVTQEPEQKPEKEPEAPPILPSPVEGVTQEPEQKPEKEPEALPILPSPVEDVTQETEPMKPPVPLETIPPEQPQTDIGGTEKPTNGEGAAVAAQSLTWQPPQLREDVPVMSIQKGKTAESTPLDQTQSPRTDEITVPTPITGENENHAGQRSDNESEAESNHSSLPMAATVAIALVGGGIAVSVGVGAASGTVSGSSFWGKLLKALRNPFSKQ